MLNQVAYWYCFWDGGVCDRLQDQLEFFVQHFVEGVNLLRTMNPSCIFCLEICLLELA